MYIKLFSEMPSHVIIHEDHPVCIARFEIRFSEDIKLGMAYHYSNGECWFNWITTWPQQTRDNNELRVKNLVMGYYAEKVLLGEDED